MNNYASRLANLQRELLKLKSSQVYGLSEQHFYTFKSPRIYSKMSYGAQSCVFAFSFEPIVDAMPMARILINTFSQSGEVMPASEVQYLESGGVYNSLHSVRIDASGRLILKNERYSISKIQNVGGYTVPQTPFSIEVEMYSTVDGAMTVTPL